MTQHTEYYTALKRGEAGLCTDMKTTLFCFVFFLMATPMTYGSSQAREFIKATAATYSTAAATPDPLTHYSRSGIKPTPLHRSEPPQSDS